MFYRKKSERLGIDCWRAFECSWLNTKGVPQRTFLELVLENDHLALDSFALKQHLLSLTQERFNSQNEMISHLGAKLQGSALLELRPFEHQLVSSHPLEGYAGPYCHRNTVRFLCDQSDQPYQGELFLSFLKPLENEELLDWILLDARSKRFNQADYIDHLALKLQSHAKGFIISLHLARRGGISY